MHPILSPATTDGAKARFCKAFDCCGSTEGSRFSHPRGPDTPVTWLCALLWGDGLGNSATSSTGQPQPPCLSPQRDRSLTPLLTKSLSFAQDVRGNESGPRLFLTSLLPHPHTAGRTSACLTVFTHKDVVGLTAQHCSVPSIEFLLEYRRTFFVAPSVSLLGLWNSLHSSSVFKVNRYKYLHNAYSLSA